MSLELRTGSPGWDVRRSTVPATIVAVGHDLGLLSRTRPSRAATECLGTMATLYDTVPSSPGSLSVPGTIIISSTLLTWTSPLCAPTRCDVPTPRNFPSPGP